MQSQGNPNFKRSLLKRADNNNCKSTQDETFKVKTKKNTKKHQFLFSKAARLFKIKTSASFKLRNAILGPISWTFASVCQHSQIYKIHPFLLVVWSLGKFYQHLQMLKKLAPVFICQAVTSFGQLWHSCLQKPLFPFKEGWFSECSDFSKEYITVFKQSTLHENKIMGCVKGKSDRSKRKQIVCFFCTAETKENLCSFWSIIPQNTGNFALNFFCIPHGSRKATERHSSHWWLLGNFCYSSEFGRASQSPWSQKCFKIMQIFVWSAHKRDAFGRKELLWVSTSQDDADLWSFHLHLSKTPLDKQETLDRRLLGFVKVSFMLKIHHGLWWWDRQEYQCPLFLFQFLFGETIKTGE